LAIDIEIALIATWFLLRTAFTVPSRPYLLWTIVAAGVALDLAYVRPGDTRGNGPVLRS
jgi:hypothetical protein